MLNVRNVPVKLTATVYGAQKRELLIILYFSYFVSVYIVLYLQMDL